MCTTDYCRQALYKTHICKSVFVVVGIVFTVVPLQMVILF